MSDSHTKIIALSEDCLHPKKKRNKKGKGGPEGDPEREPDEREPEKPIRKNRVITQTKKWDTIQLHLDKDSQYSILSEIHRQQIECIPESKKSPECAWMLQEIHRKINGYKCQDIEKNLYDLERFVDTEYVIQRLIDSQLHCYYCREDMHILYGEVRNPKQWSLERIDNEYGHNKDNVEIACLQCNLRRKTMYHERFLFTKQLGSIVKTH